MTLEWLAGKLGTRSWKLRCERSGQQAGWATGMTAESTGSFNSGVLSCLCRARFWSGRWAISLLGALGGWQSLPCSAAESRALGLVTALGWGGMQAECVSPWSSGHSERTRGTGIIDLVLEALEHWAGGLGEHGHHLCGPDPGAQS